MEFKNELLQLGKSVEELKPYMATEEATKNALIVPFIKTLGYNVFDPRSRRLFSVPLLSAMALNKEFICLKRLQKVIACSAACGCLAKIKTIH